MELATIYEADAIYEADPSYGADQHFMERTAIYERRPAQHIINS